MSTEEQLTIAEIWEALIQSEEEKLKLGLPHRSIADTLKRRLSTHKSRVLANDKALAEALGDFTLTYDIEKEKGQVIMLVSMVREAPKKQSYVATILPITGDDNG